jgi:hypothetical protein
MRRLLMVIGGTMLASGILGGEAASPAPPKFTAKPTATKAGDKVKIEFAVDRETDVAVFIENGGGKVVRHLVAGVLGANAPAPLKPGLAQSVEWDGRADWGKPAEGGPFKVRVALGLGARYDKVLHRDPQAMGTINGLGVGAGGTVYVLGSVGAAWGGEQLKALNRDGSYQRTLTPFPSDVPLDRVKAYGGIEINGRPAPAIQGGRTIQMYPGGKGGRKSTLTVTPDGIILWLVNERYGPAQVVAVGTDGGLSWPQYLGPALPGQQLAHVGPSPTAVSADGRSLYISGLGWVEKGQSFACVYKVKLPERGPAEVFFGEAGKPGKDQTHLGGAAQGLATDGKGNLLISDTANDRVVVVAENDGKYVGELPAPKPDHLAVNSANGEIYVLSAAGQRSTRELLKFSGWKDAKKLSSLPLKTDGDGTMLMAADCSAQPPVVWCATDRKLLRIEDQGGKFGTPADVGSPASPAYLDMTVDHWSPDKPVYMNVSRGGSPTVWLRYNDAGDSFEKIAISSGSGGGTGPCLRPSPDGTFYGVQWPCSFNKWDRTGKPLAWEKPDHRDVGQGEGSPTRGNGKWPATGTYVPTSMCETPHTIGVRQDGRILIFVPNLYDRGLKALHEYLPTGERVTTDPSIWCVSDAVVGPKFDQAGNIYVAEIVKPANWVYPPEYQKAYGPIKVGEKVPGAKGGVANFYGSVLKFSPKGGMIHYKEKTDGLVSNKKPYEGEPKLDPGLKTADACYLDWYNNVLATKVTGAEWMHPGYSHINSTACTCENSSFDVDEFGRTWFPDLCMFQVRVIDTNGNAITNFGGYGNAESMGPDSAVVDPQTKKVRARRADDPKDLKSPFAEPEIAFSWLIGVGATDKYVYTCDVMNRRMLRLRQIYAAEETCQVQ